MKNRIRQSLSLKLSLGILLLAVPVFVISLGILFYQSRHIVRKEAMELATTMINTASLRVDRYLMAVETATNINEWQIAENLQPDSLLAISSRTVRLNPHINGCSISAEPNLFPSHGRYFSVYAIRESDTIRADVEQQYEYFNKIWYKTPHDLKEPCWVVYYDEVDSLDIVLDGMIASYGKPLYDKEDHFIGVISSDVSLQQMSKVITAEKPYPNSYYMMIGKDGYYYIHSDTTMLFQQAFADGSPFTGLKHEMAIGKQGSMRVYIDGKPNLVCYHPVANTGWCLALVCPDSDILQGYHRLGYVLTPLLIIGLIVILLLTRRAVNQATTPLNQLLEYVQDITHGNYEIHIPHSKNTDAIGRLQNSFATMLHSLNFHMGSIRYAADKATQRNEELAKATKLAEEADRQKTLFIQNVTHQIRTPLNIIMGFSQILRDTNGMLPEEEEQEIFNTMNHNAMSLSRMVLMLYDSSDSGIAEDLNSNKDEIVPCNEVVRESIEHTKTHFPDMSIHFKTVLPDDRCIRSSRLYLMRSLRELLYNAAKYSDRQHVAVSVSETPTTVRFIFEDKGPGMPEDYRDLMFVPFTKVNDLSEGLGLGLPLAKRHILNMGGEFTLDPDYHDGCRFIIELPK